MKEENYLTLKEKYDLLGKICRLVGYFDRHTIEFLESLVKLEKSVFSDAQLGESMLRDLELFIEIAKYNICNHTIKVIKEIQSLDKEKLQPIFLNDRFSITYKDSLLCFDVFDFDFSMRKIYTRSNYLYINNQINNHEVASTKMIIDLYEINMPLATQIELLENNIEKLDEIIQKEKKKSYKYYYGNQIRLPVYTGVSERKKFFDRQRLEHMKDTLNILEKYGQKQIDISNEITQTLVNNWGIEFDYTKETPVKKLSWINVYKNQVNLSDNF
ncbi:MAG: hypothetical protein NC181_03345 [Clostridium sp.]|nr:hypothetical protein [Clostridium sp.]MCM1444326.1 hypothetical protein [Candidatus Amulumruptor caecigallinarius]